MLSGVTISESKSQKDELILEGADIDMVSQSGAFTMLLTLTLLVHHPFSFNSGIYPGHLPSEEQRYPKVLGRYLRLGQDYRRPGVVICFPGGLAAFYTQNSHVIRRSVLVLSSYDTISMRHAFMHSTFAIASKSESRFDCTHYDAVNLYIHHPTRGIIVPTRLRYSTY